MPVGARVEARFLRGPEDHLMNWRGLLIQFIPSQMERVGDKDIDQQEQKTV